jgi:hypothetical protein
MHVAEQDKEPQVGDNLIGGVGGSNSHVRTLSSNQSINVSQISISINEMVRALSLLVSLDLRFYLSHSYVCV